LASQFSCLQLHRRALEETVSGNYRPSLVLTWQWAGWFRHRSAPSLMFPPARKGRHVWWTEIRKRLGPCRPLW